MSEESRKVYPGQIYRHFKNNLYQIITVASHTEREEKLVIYQKLYDDFSVYARPLEMFLSEVDTSKYPNVKQKYRFELVKENIEIAKCTVNDDKEIVNKELLDNGIKKVEEDSLEEGADPILLEFLDADTFEEKRRVLISIKDSVTDRLIDDMAASIDVTVDDGDIDTRFSSLLNCINTRAKYEVTRLR